MLKIVLLGALALTALFAVPVGTMRFVGPNPETAGVAPGPTLDCGSPRDAWRPACQSAKTVSARDSDVTGSIGDEAAEKARRRSTADAAVRLDASANASPTPAPVASQAAPPQQLAQAAPEPVRPEPNPTGGGEAQPWRDPVRSDPAQTQSAPAPRLTATDQGDAALAEKGRAPRSEPVQAAAPSTNRPRAGGDVKPGGLSPKNPVPASDTAAAEAAPARGAKSVAVEERPKPAAAAEPAPGPSRRELRRAARAAAARAAQARQRVVAEQSEDDEPVRKVRRRARPVKETIAEARRPRRVASVRPWSRRAMRRGPLHRAYASTGDLRVSSVQTYVLPDGRRVVVNVRPRPSVIRELAAQHAAAFPSRRSVGMPYRGGPGWGGGWLGAGFDD